MQLLVSSRRISITRERNNGERVVTPGWHTGQLFRSRRELPDFQRKPSPELCDTLCRVPQSPPRSFRSQQHRRHGGFQWHQPAILIRYISDTNGRYVNSNLFVTCLRRKNVHGRNSDCSGKGKKTLYCLVGTLPHPFYIRKNQVFRFSSVFS